MKTLSKISGVAIITLLTLCGGCDKRPKGVLSDSEMESLMTDLLLAEAYSKSADARDLPDSVRNRLGEAVLKEHGVDQATLDSTYAWYSRNLDDYFKLYSRVDKNLQQRRQKVGGSASDEIENDIWTLPRHLVLSPNGYGNSLTFTLPGDVLTGGEQLRWRLRMNGTSSINVLLGIDYEDGTSSIIRREFQGGKVDVSLVADTAHNARRIFGFISASKRDMPIFVDSISLAKNPFDSVFYASVVTQRRLTPPAKVVKMKPDTLKTDMPRGDKDKSNANIQGGTKVANAADQSRPALMHPVKSSASSRSSDKSSGASNTPSGSAPRPGSAPSKRPAKLGDH